MERSMTSPCQSVADDLSDSSSDIEASDEDLDSIGEFCFETPRLAYKTNSDYKNLLQSIIVLKAQLYQARQDKITLRKLREEALTDPLAFFEKFQRNEIEFPKPQKIAPVPVIDWSKYDTSGNKASFQREQIKRLSSAKSLKRKRHISDYDNEVEVEGDNSDVEAFTRLNHHWSKEEQKRLEALLLQYPPEEVETRRWEKIALALGNRTARQVASRVQKYFIKLMQEGKPIPGRMPNKSYLPKSKMNQKVGGSQNSSICGDENFSFEEIEVSDEDDISPELRNSTEYEELILIKKVLKRKKEQSFSKETSTSTADNFDANQHTEDSQAGTSNIQC